MQYRLSTYFSALVLIALCASCSVEKYIPEGERLYTGAEIIITPDSTITNQSSLQTELEGVLRPTPNSKILGGYPYLSVFYKAQREKPGVINKWLNKKIGEEPVYQSDVEEFEVESLLRNRLENRGFFYSTVSSRFRESETKKRASITYDLKVAIPHGDVST